MSIQMIDTAASVIARTMAPHLLGQLRIGRDDVDAAFAEALLQSQKFEFTENLFTEALYDAALEALRSGLLPIPSDIFYFEWAENVEGNKFRFACLCSRYQENSIDVHLVIRSYNFGEDIYWNSLNLSPDGIRSIFDNEEFLTGNEQIAMRVLCLLMALQCRDVVVHDCGPSPSIKRKREKRGLPPIVEYKKVTIKPELRGVYEAAHGEFERNRPRFHFRRGHIRNLHNGKRTYVSPCWVGDAAIGVVEKEYKVTQ